MFRPSFEYLSLFLIISKATPPTPNLSPASPSPLEEARQRSNTQLPASKSLALGVEDIALAKFNFANRFDCLMVLFYKINSYIVRFY